MNIPISLTEVVQHGCAVEAKDGLTMFCTPDHLIAHLPASGCMSMLDCMTECHGKEQASKLMQVCRYYDTQKEWHGSRSMHVQGECKLPQG